MVKGDEFGEEGSEGDKRAVASGRKRRLGRGHRIMIQRQCTRAAAAGAQAAAHGSTVTDTSRQRAAHLPICCISRPKLHKPKQHSRLLH